MCYFPLRCALKTPAAAVDLDARLPVARLVTYRFTFHDNYLQSPHGTFSHRVADRSRPGGRRGATSVRRYSPANEAIRIMLIRIMLTVEAITPMAGYTLNKLYAGKRVQLYYLRRELVFML